MVTKKSKKNPNSHKESSDTKEIAMTTNTQEISKEGDWRKRFLIPIIIVLLAALVYVGMQQLVVATVNGTPISRLTMMGEMESQIGEQVLDSLITKQLIMQAASKQSITVTEEEIDQELEKLKEQFATSGQNFDDVLKMQNITMERVREELRMQKIIEKAVASDIEVTEEEINAFIEQNKSFMPEGQDTADQKFRDDIKEQIKQQKTGTQMRTWIEDLKSKADIKYFGSFAKTPTPTPAPLELPTEPSTATPSGE